MESERPLALPKPREIPEDEWTKAELERGATFPEHMTSLRARLKTPEQHALYEFLEKSAEEVCKELFDKWPEPWTLSREQLNEIVLRYEVSLINIASQARGLADSYRKFDVGGAVIGYQDTRVHKRGENPRYASDVRENPWRVLFDANTRPETDEGIVVTQRGAKELGRHSEVRKYCAELYLSDRIDPSKPEHGLSEEKLIKAIALFVVGEAQTDNDSKMKQITLTSCKLCRDRLWKMSQPVDVDGKAQRPVYDEDMPVISADARNLHNRKWQPINRLHEFHGEKLPPGHEEL
ncbi:MAG: hypothetical protein AAB480_02320 [Patescibacteria group bacterium]